MQSQLRGNALVSSKNMGNVTVYKFDASKYPSFFKKPFMASGPAAVEYLVVYNRNAGNHSFLFPFNFRSRAKVKGPTTRKTSTIMSESEGIFLPFMAKPAREVFFSSNLKLSPTAFGEAATLIRLEKEGYETEKPLAVNVDRWKRQYLICSFVRGAMAEVPASKFSGFAGRVPGIVRGLGSAKVLVTGKNQGVLVDAEGVTFSDKQPIGSRAISIADSMEVYSQSFVFFYNRLWHGAKARLGFAGE